MSMLDRETLHARLSELKARHPEPPWAERIVVTENAIGTLICQAPGHPNDRHFHLKDEWWIVLGGQLEWELTGGVIVRATKDDIVWVPRGTVHHIRNIGDDLSLRLAVAMPPAMHYFSPCEQCGYSDEGPREWCA